MPEGFLTIYFGMVASWTHLGVIIGLVSTKHNRKKGAIIGAILGVTLGSVFATVTSFDTSSPKELPPVVAE